MRIGINALYMLPDRVGGSEIILRGLIHGLSRIDMVNEYIIFTNKENHASIDIKGNNFSKILCHVSATSRFRRIAYEQLVLPFLITKYAIDLLHSPGYVSPLMAKCHTVVTIADLQYAYYPHFFLKLKLWYWKTFIQLSVQKADSVITISAHSKKDIRKCLHVSDEKIFVAYQDTKFHIDHYGMDQDETVLGKIEHGSKYIMCLASPLPHKNIDRLLYAFKQLLDRIDHKLILAGATSSKTLKIIEQLGLKQRVILLGYVSDSELITLYKKASLFVFPSLFEGFGLPLVEAMNFGCPIAASNRTSIAEVVGNAGVLFDPEDTEAIGVAIYQILSNDAFRNELIDRGYGRAKAFSWDNMARITLEAYYRSVTCRKGEVI